MKSKQKLNGILSGTEGDYSIQTCLNGFVIEVRGRDHESEWTTLKYVVQSVADLLETVGELTKVKRL